MYAPTKENQGSRYGRDDYGKCLCVSVPFHKLNRIDDMDRNSHMEFCKSRSEYLLKLVDRDTELKKKQLEEMQLTDWTSMFGEK